VKLPRGFSGAPYLVQLPLVLIKEVNQPSQSTDQTVVVTTLHLQWVAKTASNYIWFISCEKKRRELSSVRFVNEERRKFKENATFFSHSPTETLPVMGMS
jgi:hypothetical protein